MLVSHICGAEQYKYSAIHNKSGMKFSNNLYNSEPLSYSYPVSNVTFNAKLPKVPTKLERFEGCLIGGAIGDAMGYPLEALTIKDIYQRFGNTGLHYPIKKGRVYRFSDDTQMTLFTIKGLLKSLEYNYDLKKEPIYKMIYDAYQDWYKTQTIGTFIYDDTDMFNRKELYNKRGPGRTCLSSLESKIMGTLDKPINDSGANGAVMRVAPVGLIYGSHPELAFNIGMKVGAMTHGNERAYLPAGFLSCLIAWLQQGKPLEEALENSINILTKISKHENVLSLIEKAKELAKTDLPGEKAIEKIGMGYTGDEALAISIYSALKNPNNFKRAIITAINHSGDSDTTGSITGNIMGTLLGSSFIHRCWKDNIELSDLLYRCSSDLVKAKESCERYYNMTQRRRSDIFSGKITKLRFTTEDYLKMQSMNKEEKEQYIWKLKQKLNK